MEKAFAYIRVSGKGQLEGDGFTRQRAAIKAFALANGIRIAKVFEEKAVSGTKDSDDRPAFQEMLLAMLGNGVRTVIIEKLDRIARDLMIQEAIIGDLRRRGFKLLSTEEPDLCSDQPTRVLLRQFMGAISQYEKSMIVLKLRGARQRTKARTGRCEGEKPYGYRDGEQAVLERMQTLRGQGMAWDAIAATLNAEGVPTRYSGRWFGSTVNKIVKAAAPHKKPTSPAASLERAEVAA